MTEFDHYLTALVASWRALASPRAEAAVTEGDGFVAARFAESVFNNAVVLRPDAVAPAEAVYGGTTEYALWCRDDDPGTAAVLARRGYRVTEVTRPMRCDLADVAPPAEAPPVLHDADPDRVAELNGVPAYLLRDVPGLRAYATHDYLSGLVLQRSGSDVYVSFVATHPEARGRGLATAVTAAALADARRLGAETATLQASAMAERLYGRLGFRPVARWHEWSRAA
ncbi:GNAT family N-acetyltransferase [Actinoplanes sp. URMC 104]|uniref:GNAT family N-acetyltransferase n=1 Tax=Actinoplanes sp. URMC 104 TaxID=3423409 RepID=UPI003F1A2D90